MQDNERPIKLPVDDGLFVPDWPIDDAIDLLIHATYHLLREHDCDGPKHEEYLYAMRNAQRFMDGRTEPLAQCINDHPVHLERIAELERQVGVLRTAVNHYADCGGTCVECGCQKAVHSDRGCALDDCSGFKNVAQSAIKEQEK